MIKGIVAICSLFSVTDAYYKNLFDINTSKGDYKVYNCWDCFQARGKMCHNENYSKHKRITKSSNLADAICCKPGSTTKVCRNGRT